MVLYTCDGFADLAHGPLAPATGVLGKFDIIHYPPGLVLQLPEQEQPRRMRKFRDQPQMFRIFQQHKHWGRMVGVHNVGMLNAIIARGEMGNFIRIAESFHEKRIAELADLIAARRRKVKIILISGPSSAGKTTLAKRLAVQLQVNGIKTSTISLDNYYVDDPDTPRDEAGQPDYEHINAVDVPLFNRNMLALIKGRPIDLPYFNFNTKRREFRGEKMQLPPGQMLIVEGIHGLNPRFSPMIANANKFRIYISALTQLNLDANNRISTTDNRLMRRIVRDYRYRGNAPGATLRMWPSVRRGEKTWIFPFQTHADFVFNSALDYELAVLKPMLTPILTEIKPSQPEYAEARRMQAFLDYFLEVPISDVPTTSILREYIGASSFKY
ncbi:MAG: hypothetical protein LC725_12250 [Lentisphaerae bacterium]|nr:hypothetical protein [Lentisphaerota bacterium]